MSSYVSMTYSRRKEAGLCPKCGGERDREDRVTCSKCRLFFKGAYRVFCKTRTEEEHRLFNMKKNMTQKALNTRRRSAGLCVRCGAPSPDHWHCEACRLKRKKKEAAKAKEEDHW